MVDSRLQIDILERLQLLIFSRKEDISGLDPGLTHIHMLAEREHSSATGRILHEFTIYMGLVHQRCYHQSSSQGPGSSRNPPG